MSIFNRFQQQIAALDQQVERQAIRTRSSKDRISNAVEEGMSVARKIEEAVNRMIHTYNEFLEKILRDTMETLNCQPEEMDLTTLPLEPYGDFLKSTQILSVREVEVMKIERFQLSEHEYQFIATPIEGEDEVSSSREEE